MFRVWGLGFGIWGTELRGFGFRIWSLRFRDFIRYSLVLCRVKGYSFKGIGILKLGVGFAGYRILGCQDFRVQSFEFRG